MQTFTEWLDENFEEDDNPYWWDKDSDGYRKHKFHKHVENLCNVVNRIIVPEGFELYVYSEAGDKILVALDLPIRTRLRFKIGQLQDGSFTIEGILRAENWVQGLKSVQFREMPTVFLNIVRSIQEKGYSTTTQPDGKKLKQSPLNGFDHSTG